MSVYILGDPHLSLSCNKPMDIFPGWSSYVERLTENWNNTVKPEDTVILAGDISWGISLEAALADFQYLQNLPGKKILLKGNHDYWWSTKKKMEEFFSQNGLTSLEILNNNSVFAEGLSICGSRGWMFEDGQPADQKIIARECGRLRMSLEDAKKHPPGERIVVLHYPPIYGNDILAELVDLMLEYQIKRCYYGHIHGAGTAYALNGNYLGIDFRLISCDFVHFNPVKVQ